MLLWHLKKLNNLSTQNKRYYEFIYTIFKNTKTHADHVRMAKMGYTHEKPKSK